MLLLVIVSCKKEVSLNFVEHSVERSEDAVIALNYPKAEGTEAIASQINKILENHISSQFNLSEETDSSNTLEEAITQFNTEYNTFIKDFPDATQQWEALIDGEVTYRSSEVISIVISTYLDTGGAHGNTNVRFFNFNPNTGELLNMKALVSDVEGLSSIIQSELKSEIEANANEPMENLFFGNDFKLPETLGFNDDGLIILYNRYEIASYAQGIVEFSIPFEKVQGYLQVR